MRRICDLSARYVILYYGFRVKYAHLHPNPTTGEIGVHWFLMRFPLLSVSVSESDCVISVQKSDNYDSMRSKGSQCKLHFLESHYMSVS